MLEKVKRIIKTLIRHEVYVKIQSKIDRVIARIGFKFARQKESKESIIIAGFGAGNIGDEAMVRALIERLSGNVSVFVGDKAPRDYPTSVQVSQLPALISHPYPVRTISMFKYGHALKNANAVYIIGADVVDGVYSLNESGARLNLATISKNCDIKTMVTGFSWSDRFNPRIDDYIDKTGKIAYMLRDPISYQRFHNRYPSSNATQVADLAFSTSTTSSLPQDLIGWISSSEKAIAVLNVSGLIRHNGSFVEEYRKIYEKLRELGYRVLFLPHVIRSYDNDLVAINEVTHKYISAQDKVVSQLLGPEAIRALLAHVDLVTTGRMHLAILSLQAGVPAFALSTQGKVSGLFEMFGLQELVVDPLPGFGEKIISLLDEIDFSNAEKLISLHSLVVKSLANKHFKDNQHK